MAKVNQSSYRKWMPHNLQVLKKKCRFQVLNVSQPKLINLLKTVASKVVNEINTITSTPNYTGNLRDSIGVGVYTNGSLSYFIPTQTATMPQRSGFHGRNEYNIWGTEYLSRSLQDAVTDFSDGIWIVLFAAVPYAFYINEYHTNAGFFDEISDTIINEVRNGLVQLEIKNIQNFVPYNI